MKFARLLLIIFGVILVLGGALFAVALLPAVQHWAVLRAAREVPGLKLEVAEVNAGFSGIVLRNVSAEQQRVVVKLERLEADFSLMGLLFGRRLDISRLAVTGLNLDASHVARTKAGAAAAGAPAAAPGLLARVQLPFDLKLDDTRIEGRALLPGAANQPPVEAQYTITGGKIAAGQEGLLQLNATIRDPAPGATVTTLRVQAGLRATLGARRTFSKVSLTTLVDAEGPELSGGQSQLKVGAELFHSSSGENYEVSIDTVLRGTTENILKLQARLPATSRQYAGDWQLKARTVQIAPFALGAPLPDFDVRGGGKFVFDPAAAGASLQGTLQGQLSRLEAIDPAWRAFGTVKVDAAFDVGQQGGILNLNQFQAVVAGAQPVLDARITAPIRYDLHKNQLVAAGQSAENLLHVNLAGLPVAWIRPFITMLDVSGGLITGQFDVARVSGTDTAAAVHGQVQLNDMTVVQEGRPLLSHAAVTLRTEATLADSLIDASLFELNLKTPEGDALNLTGRFSTRTDANPPLSVAATFKASSPKLFARWLPGAPVAAQGEINATLQGDKLDVLAGRLQVQQGGNKPLVNVAVLQPFKADLGTLAVAPANAASPVARLEVTRLPLGLLPGTAPDAVLGGFVQQGEFEVGVQGSKVVVKALKPVQLTEVSLTQGRQPALTSLAIEALPVIEYTGPENFRLQSGDVTVRTADKATLFTLKAEATQTPDQGTQTTATFALEIPVLATQPLFADAQAVSAGKATGEIRAVLGARRQIEARVTLNGLIAAEGGHTLPVANVGFRAVSQPNRALSIQVPVLLDNAGRRSDLNFALELSPLGRGHSVDGKLTGQQVELDDLLGVLGVFLAAAAPDNGDKPVAAGARSPDAVAAWAQFSGQLSLDIKTVNYGKEWAMTGLTGGLAIEPARLALNKLSASFSETSRLAAQMEMRFTGGPLPYRLTGDYSLNDFDVGKLFKAIDPSKPPTVEGLFSVTGKLSGNGETTGRALDRLHGDFQLTSRGGIFRGFARAGNKVSAATKAVDMVAALGSIFGSEKVKQSAEKVAGQSYYVDQLAQSMGEIKYDLLSAKLSRDEQLNMSLEEIGLVSPELRLTGSGEVTYEAGKALLDQPLTASLNLAARGKTEELLGKIKVLDGTKDELGYAKAKEPVTLKGTLAKPDPTAFFAKLASAKISELLDNGN